MYIRLCKGYIKVIPGCISGIVLIFWRSFWVQPTRALLLSLPAGVAFRCFPILLALRTGLFFRPPCLHPEQDQSVRVQSLTIRPKLVATSPASSNP